ncbi:hypothetical protein BU14_2013s0001 [Porphyra umbilicalis]|uniref:Uncharacterized protein n=1 Tax=Porphyra umbilicalis TaxID=2786 RepID=A0A1X6NKG5_PORUM|nr:hypothetical protein BU14_2013s0001 [Porphyra umbilicalis]|eukprot:OSX68976.1 hypothetical protein BU14_2013s0001 [Porphyra umbilicalis]
MLVSCCLLLACGVSIRRVIVWVYSSARSAAVMLSLLAAVVGVNGMRVPLWRAWCVCASVDDLKWTTSARASGRGVGVVEGAKFVRARV